MIICGFPGIGKSHLVKYWYSGDYVDLESSLFTKDENWVEDYCKVAIELHNQGFKVLTSTHADIREYFISQIGKTLKADHVIEFFPVPELKDEWIERLKERYNKTLLEKDLKAYEYVKDNFDKCIREMQTDMIKHKIKVSTIDYILYDALEAAFDCLRTMKINSMVIEVNE